MSTSARPEPEFGRRTLHFFFMLDCSGSMQGAKIAALNTACETAIPAMREVAAKNPEAQVLVRVITFSDNAQWAVLPTDLNDFKWKDLTADGVTDMGKALEMVAEELKPEKLGKRLLKPVIVLASDGQPTDNFDRGLKALMDQTLGKKAICMAIAIGDDADEDVLKKFIGNPEIKLLKSDNSADLVNKIHWMTTMSLGVASRPRSEVKQDGTGSAGTPIPAPPADTSAGGNGVMF